MNRRTQNLLAADPLDLPCAACSYNLRGLDVESVCPECGTPIHRSRGAGPMLAWRRTFRRGVGALGIAMILVNFGLGLLDTALRGALMQLHINFEGSEMMLQSVALFPAAFWLTRLFPPGQVQPRSRRPILFATLAMLFGLGVSNLINFPNTWYISSVLLLSGYALGPIVFAVAIFEILAPIADAARFVPNALPRMVVHVVRWLLFYGMLSPALSGAVVNFTRIRYIRAPMPTHGYWVDPALAHWMQTWLDDPARSILLPVFLATLLVLAHTFYRLHGPAILPVIKAERTARGLAGN
jgi:hypothetical protein